MRKYIGQVKSDNFVYPNNVLEEYDVEIIHDINDNSVSGTTSGFSALYNGGTGNIGISFTYIWNKNNAEPFIDDSGQLHVLSVHMSDPTKKYYKPWRMISGVTTSSVTATTVTDTFLIIVTPAMMGLTSFTTGTYDFEIRFIGKKAIYPVCQTSVVNAVTPTPVPASGCTSANVCMALNVTGVTGPEGPFGQIEYNDCDGVLVGEIFTTNGTRYRCVQYTGGLPQIFSYSGMEEPTIYGGNCNLYVCPTGVTTSTPTPTPTGGAATPTPTPTATASPATPTPTPTATSVGPTATPTPTATPLPTYTYLVNCSGTLQGYCLGNLSAGQQVTIGGLCYVATTTTEAPVGTEITGAQTLGTCCPTPTPTPTPAPVGIGIYTGATFATSTAACLDSNIPNGTVYIANGDTLSNGDFLYTDTSLTTEFVGDGLYYRLLSGVYYAASISPFGGVSLLTNCSGGSTPTPTPTITATPTATPIEYDYYTADVSDCAACGTTTETIEVGFIAGTPVTPGRFYIPVGGPDGLAYQINSSTFPSGPVLILTNAFGSFTSCASACSA